MGASKYLVNFDFFSILSKTQCVCGGFPENFNYSGTIGAIGVCDTIDGQCACKAHVASEPRICNECKDGFFGLDAIKGLGCTYCQCDPGGAIGTICEKTTGNCTCKTGLEGRQCNEVSPNYFLPTMHQFQYEIEDGYR